MTAVHPELSHPRDGGRSEHPGPARTRFVDVLAMEWTKLRSVPSTFFALAVTLVVGIGLSALVSGLAANEYRKGTTPGIRESWDPTAVSTAGGSLAQLAVAVLATLVITAEYSTGEIRATLVACPTRIRLLAAKAFSVAALAVVVGEITVFISFFIGQALISGDAPVARLGDPGVLRSLLGTGLYLILLVWLALGIGTLLRGTAATISTLVAMLYVLPGIASALPASWRDPIMEYWPTQAGGQITTVVRADHTLAPWAGLGVMACFVGIVLVAAAVRLDRSDV